MPVTAKLSRAFNDRFGDAIVDEPVDWFNQVDATFRDELRELDELNFARFNATVEARMAELRLEFREGLARLEMRLAESDAKLERRLGAQTRWFIAMWPTMMATGAAIWLKA